MEQNETHITENLTRRQLVALPHLIKPGSLAAKARHAGVARATLYRWLEDDNFRKSLEQLREETLRFAQSEFQAMSYRATAVINEALDDDNLRVRLQAARIVMAEANGAHRDREVRRRLENLTDAVTLHNDPQWRPR